MTNNLKYFLVVAEELNIRKAAERVFISPQCMSNHIKRLEELYEVKLFQRKPRFELTDEGKALVLTLKKIQIIENALKEQIKDISSKGSEGILKIGMHSSRARSMMPEIYSRFYKEYPNIKVSVSNTVVAESEKMVIDGELNLFIGPYSVRAPELNIIELFKEVTYYVIPDNILKGYFGREFPECKEKFKKGIDIRDFKDIPIFMSNESSILYTTINNFLIENGVNPRYIFETNSNDLLFELSSMGYGACFCPAMMLNLLYSPRIIEYNGHQHLNVFPINNYNQKRSIVLGYHKDAYLPKYTKYFIDIAKEVSLNWGSINTKNNN